MKNLSAILFVVALVSCAGMQKPDADDARKALDAAVQACAFRDSLPAKAKAACDKLDAAAVAARDAANVVLDTVPEPKQ